MQTARNVAIIAVAAFGVALVPGGGEVADVILAAITLGFMAAIGVLASRLYRENRMTLWTMEDRPKAIFYGAFGMIALMIAGAGELLDTGGGTLVWLGLLAVSVFAIIRIWMDANRYA